MSVVEERETIPRPGVEAGPLIGGEVVHLDHGCGAPVCGGRTAGRLADTGVNCRACAWTSALGPACVSCGEAPR